MLLPELLLGTLNDLGDADFNTFKWHLTLGIVEDWPPIPKSRLDRAERTDTVDRLMEYYREKLAVNITVEVLKKMNNNLAADQLRTKYEGET